MKQRTINPLRLLLIGGTHFFARKITNLLERSGHQVDYSISGKLGVRLAKEHHFDAIVVCVRTRGQMDGFQACRKFRENLSWDVPLVMVGESTDATVPAFRAGADIYMAHPFSHQELDARLGALLRRIRATPIETLRVHTLELDLSTLEVQREGRRLAVPRMGTRILRLLMEVTPNIVTRRRLHELLWDGDYDEQSDANVRAHIYALRGIVDKPFDRHLIHTHRGFGYRILATQDAPDGNA